MKISKSFFIVASAVLMASPMSAVNAQRVGMTELPPEKCTILVQENGYHCYETVQGWILAKNPTLAQSIAKSMEHAGTGFEKYFGRKAERVGVVVGTNVYAKSTAALKKLGAELALPWIDMSDPNGEVAQSVRQQMATQLKQQFPAKSQGEIDEMVEPQLTKFLQMVSGAAESNDKGNPLDHEIGHVMFMSTFWRPNQQQKTDSHYGGPAADWLDEAAAILMENAVLTKTRRDKFVQDFKSSRRSELIKPLATFFTMPHPSSAEEDDSPGTSKKPDSVTAVTVTVKDKNAKDSESAFYNQCRSLIDFLLERSGDPKIFQSIAENEARGSTMAAWLKTHGPQYRLPGSVEELDREWTRWVEGKMASK